MTSTKLMLKLTLSIFCFALILPNQLMAKEKIISGKFTTEFFNDNNYDSSLVNNEFNENFIRSKLDLKVKLNKNFYLKSRTTFKEVNTSSEKTRRAASSDNGDDSSFENEAIFIKELNLNYDYKNASFLAGKFTTKFGQSWHREDNIWLFEEARLKYRQDEKIGFASYFKAGDSQKNGEYNLGVAVFNNDDKYLDGSVITKKDGGNKSDGTPGDKKDLKSYVASMDINYDFNNEEKLSYHFAYMNLSVNEKQSPVIKEKIEDAEGYVVNMNYQYPFNKNFLGEGFIEYVNINNADGNSDKDEDFLTTSLSLYFFKAYNATIGRYKRKETQIGTNGIDTEIREFNLGYKFQENSPLQGLQIMAGIKREEMDLKTSKVKDNVAGILARYIKEF